MARGEVGEEAVEPGEDPLGLEVVVGRVDVGQAEEFGAVDARGEGVEGDAVGGIGELGVVVVLKVVGSSGGRVGFGYYVEVAVHATLGAYHGTGGERRHDVGEVKEGEELGYQVLDRVGEGAEAVLVGLVHDKGALAGAAEEVVVNECHNGVIEKPEHHQRLRAERESAYYDAPRVDFRAGLHPVEHHLVLPGGEP